MKNHQDIKLYVYKIDIFYTKALKKFLCKLFNLLWWFVVVPLTKCKLQVFVQNFYYVCLFFNSPKIKFKIFSWKNEDILHYIFLLLDSLKYEL